MIRIDIIRCSAVPAFEQFGRSPGGPPVILLLLKKGIDGRALIRTCRAATYQVQMDDRSVASKPFFRSCRVGRMRAKLLTREDSVTLY
jgi:hypothetical protein